MRHSAEELLRKIETAVEFFECVKKAADPVDRLAIEVTFYRLMGASLGDELEAAGIWLRFKTGTTRN